MLLLTVTLTLNIYILIGAIILLLSQLFVARDGLALRSSPISCTYLISHDSKYGGGDESSS